MEHVLDKPIWNALGGLQREFGTVGLLARAYLPDVSLLAATGEPAGPAFDELSRLTGARPVGVLLESASAPTPGWTIVRSAPLWQMMLADAPPPDGRGDPLGDADADDIMALAELTQPGPFSVRTRHLGSFIGLREGGRLIAMAGERMRMPGFTEISAVCSHPEHAGRGYAAALVSTLLHRILAQGSVAFLHVRADNHRAVSLYERLGFRIRRGFEYAILERARVGGGKPVRGP